MKRFLVAFVMAAMAAIGFGSVSAFAANGVARPFKAQYSQDFGTATSLWTCAGAHVVNKTRILDIETCRITGDTSPYVAGTFRSGQICPAGNPPSIVGTPACGQWPPYSLGPDQPAYWVSDFNGTIATSWTIVMIKNRDGTFTSVIVARYSS